MRAIVVTLLVLASFLGVSCASVQLPQPHTQNNTKYTNVTLDDAWCADMGYHIYVRMWENTDYDYIIQEFTMSNGGSVVECWHVPDGQFGINHRDHHYTTSAWPMHARQMVVYPGTVKDADFTSAGFAMLPENMDGSLKTDIGPRFNRSYRYKGVLNPHTGKLEFEPGNGTNHEIRGRITDCDRSLGVTWNFKYERGKLMVYLPDGSVHIYYDPVFYRED